MFRKIRSGLIYIARTDNCRYCGNAAHTKDAPTKARNGYDGLLSLRFIFIDAPEPVLSKITQKCQRFTVQF